MNAKIRRHSFISYLMMAVIKEYSKFDFIARVVGNLIKQLQILFYFTVLNSVLVENN